MRRTALTTAALFALTAALPAQATNQGLKPGPWGKRHAPEGWIIHDTEHYQVQSEAGLEKAKRLGSHMEAMLSVYCKLFPTDRSLKQFAIKLFKDHDSYLAYCNMPQAAAYYSPVDREMVCYDTGKWNDEKKAAQTGGEEGAEQDAPSRRERLEQLYGMDTLGCAAHEGWHQYFHRYVTSWVEIPSWINEGMGDYFYCAVAKEAPSRKALAAELGGLNSARLPLIRFAVKQGDHVPLAKLIRFKKDQYYGPKAGMCYAEGWALCHFLMQSKNPKYRQIIPTFVRLVKDDTNMEVITDKAFKGIDLEKMEQEWKAWVLQARMPWEKPAGKAADNKSVDAAHEAATGEPGKGAPTKGK